MKISAINIYNNYQKTQTKKRTNSVNSSYSNKNISEPSFCSNIHYSYNRSRLIDFLEQKPQPKAEGTDGIIFKFGDTAVKVAKTKETSFEAEAEILKKLPNDLKNSQKFIDRFEYRGRDVLVSNFVEGNHKKALTPNDTAKVFGVILAHDKANIIHGDLNLGNIIFSKTGDVSFIDYGAASQPSTTQVELYPNFVTNTNALKFENTGINDCLKEWSKEGKAKEFFTQYLAQKANFYTQHSQLVKDSNGQNYENNLATVLQTPTEEIIETELQRITTLDLLEQADTATNYDCNPYASIELWNKTVENASLFEKYTAEKIKTAKTEEEQTYFTYQNEIAKCFHSTLSDWREGTLSWLYEIKNPNFKPRSTTEARLQENWNKQ